MGAIRIEKQQSLESLYGLDNVESIDGNIKLNGNNDLQDIEGIENIDDVDDIEVSNNPSLCQSLVDGFIDNLESAGWMGNAILVNNSDNDEDCDGYKIDDDCDDTNPNLGGRSSDGDCDGIFFNLRL